MCESRGFDAAAITKRLKLLGLAGPDYRAQGEALQNHVIRPNTDTIVDSFNDSLVGIEEFNSIVSEFSDSTKRKETQQHYLLSLGVEIDQRQYFEERLRIGSVHQRIGVPQSLYQCSFQMLQCLLIQHIPRQIRHDQTAFEEMINFILKITTLDMSLAVESYCAETMF